MIQYICDGCEEVMTQQPHFVWRPPGGVESHFHGHKCLATWAAAMTNIGWMGRPE